MSDSFAYTGAEQMFAVPSNVSTVQIAAIGGSSGGAGGAASASVSVRPGSTLYVEVGGNGWADGWNGGGSGGGAGASDVRTVSCGLGCAAGGSIASLNSRLLVAGGGGGGGDAGGAAGSPGSSGFNDDVGDFGGGGGGAGTQSTGGMGGYGGLAQFGITGERGGSGALGQGGAGGQSQADLGAGGGGGYYGGGGGGGGAVGENSWCTCFSGGGGGGGGSSYAPGGTIGIAAVEIPSVSVSYSVPAPPGLGGSSGARNSLLIGPPYLRPDSNDTFMVRVKVPGPGDLKVLVTAWKDNLAGVAALPHPGPRRFVFARAHVSARRAMRLRLAVKPTRAGRLLVAHHRSRTTLRLWVIYRPKGGVPRSYGYFGLPLPSFR